MMIRPCKHKNFKLSDIFDVKGTKTTSIDELKEYGTGKYPYVTTQSTNNGVAGFYNFYTEVGNVLTIDSAVAGFCSYHEENFSASDHVEKLIPKFELNKYIALYLCSLINSNKFRFSYGRKANQKQIKNMEIPLPITTEGSIDWEYIYIYMQSLEDGIKEQIYSNLEVIMNMIAKLDKRNWVEFKIGDIFSVKRGKRIVRDIDYFTYKTGEYKYPVITSTTVNNGVDGYYNKSNCPKNTLVCGGEASGMFTTYQEEECWVMDRARILTPKNNILMNKYVGLFLATILKQNQYKYCYGRSANPDDIENLIVQLPAKNNLPDYKYMESYIRSLWGGGSLKTSVPYSKVQFNISLWKEYTIGDLFHLVNCKCSNASQLEDGDDLNYIGAKKNNNGIIKRVKYDNDLTTKGNCIIFICDGQGSIGFNNYMDEDFIGSTTLMAGYNKNLNKYNGLFITSILDLERPKFSFGRKRKKTLAQSAIKLPSLNNEPDWKYMENYIKKLQYSDLI